MKYRVLHNKNKIYDFSTFFKTKREAVEYQKIHGGILQRRIGGEWYSY